MPRHHLVIANPCLAQRLFLHRVAGRRRALVVAGALIFDRVGHAGFGIHQGKVDALGVDRPIGSLVGTGEKLAQRYLRHNLPARIACDHRGVERLEQFGDNGNCAPIDAAKYIRTAEDVVDTLNDALESGEAGYIAAVLGAIARSEGMTSIAEKSGVKRQALYRSLSEDGNPTLETLLGVLGALDLRLAVKEAEGKAA